MIVTSANFKGGPGKSCIAQNTAVRLMQRGKRVLLIDADPQETTADWIQERRQAKKFPDIRIYKMSGDIAEDLLEQQKHFDVVVVDTGGQDSDTMRSALVVSTHIIVPFRPKRRDLKQLPRMSGLIKRVIAINRTCRVMSVINQVRTLPSQLKRAVDSKESCSTFGLTPVETLLYERNVYDDADESGGSIYELGVDKKAISEFDRFLEEFLQDDF